MISKRFVTILIVLFFISLLCSRVDAQIYFSDDFENPAESETKWEVITGEWEVADGIYHQLSASSPWQASMVAWDHSKLEPLIRYFSLSCLMGVIFS